MRMFEAYHNATEGTEEKKNFAAIIILYICYMIATQHTLWILHALPRKSSSEPIKN